MPPSPRICVYILALPILLTIPAISSDNLQKLVQDYKQWVHPRKDYANTGYSRLQQIQVKNIDKLKLSWTFSTSVNLGHEGSPIVAGSIIYVHTAFPNNIYALDLNNIDILPAVNDRDSY
jgi:glucose dehydrogenase